jgi:DNA polymerase III subunit delta'
MTRIADVIGQSGPRRLLSRLIAADRLPHAVLFEGIPGCGRRTLAIAVAQALLCPRREAGDACGRCDSCRLVASATHPDLVTLPHDSESADIAVDLIRDNVVQPASETPLFGNCRAFIIPGIERLQPAAANVLLKILEEPPAGCYLIMTTTQVAAVLPTIRSRSHVYRLQPLTVADVENILIKGGMAEGQARIAAAQAHGSHRSARALEDASVPLEQLLALSRGEFVSAQIADVVAQLPQRAHKSDDGSERSIASEQRRVCRQWLDSLLQSLRVELVRAQTTELVDVIDRVLMLQSDLNRNINPRLIIEALALR